MCGFSSMQYVIELWMGAVRDDLMVIGLMKHHYLILFFSVCPIFYVLKSFTNICNLQLTDSNY